MNLDQKNIIIFESKNQLDRYKASNPSFFEDLEVLPDLEILPYDNFSPDPSLLGKPSGRDAEQGKASPVTLLGLAEARKMAVDLISEACDFLHPFGDAAHEMIALALFAIDRDH